MNLIAGGIGTRVGLLVEPPFLFFEELVDFLYDHEECSGVLFFCRERAEFLPPFICLPLHCS